MLQVLSSQGDGCLGYTRRQKVGDPVLNLPLPLHVEPPGFVAVDREGYDRSGYLGVTFHNEPRGFGLRRDGVNGSGKRENLKPLIKSQLLCQLS